MGGTRVLCVGWDGADLETIDSLIARGQLPHLARLRETGIAGPLENLPGLADDAHWSSFATSRAPGVHGRFHHAQPVAQRYYQDRFLREAMSVEPFWEQLATTGLRVATLDVPKSPLGRHSSLRVLADWMPHGEDGPDPLGIPANLVEELIARYGSAPSLDCHRVIAHGDEQDVVLAVGDRLDLRTRVALDWLQEDDWDLFQVVFAEGHCLGHHCWHVHDPSHPEHQPAVRERLGDVVEEIYGRQDEALGRLIAAAGSEAAIIVFSPLGMGPNYNGNAIVQPVLDRLAGKAMAAPPVWAGALRRTPRWITGAIPPLNRRARALNESPVAAVPYWHLSHDAISSAIRLNVVGRDRAGIIDPGSDFERHRDLLAETFRSLRRVPAGTPAVADVVDVAETFPGPGHDRFADLLIVWDTSAPIIEVTSPTLGRIVGPAVPMRTGNHRTPGWSVIAGQSRQPDVVSCQSIVDLGPAIAALLGVTLDGARERVEVADTAGGAAANH